MPLEVSGSAVWLYVGGSVLLWGGVLAIIHQMPARGKRWVLVITTFLLGMFYTFEFYLPTQSRALYFFNPPEYTNPLGPLVGPAGEIVSVIYGFAFALGLVSLFRVHGKNIARRRAGWGFSIAFFAASFGMLFFGLLDKFIPDEAAAGARYLGFSAPFIHGTFDILFEGLYVPLGATMFSVLAFYIASAAFRAFRIRTGEAGFMMLAAVVVMLGQVPLGQMLTDWIPAEGHVLSGLRVEVMKSWLLSQMSAAALRGVALGIGVGATAMALRVWLSLERGALFEMRD